MTVLRRMFYTTGSRIHLLVFVVASVLAVVVDLAQGRDSDNSLATLDWAHLIVFIWFPILVANALINLWARARYDMDTEETRGLRKWSHWV